MKADGRGAAEERRASFDYGKLNFRLAAPGDAEKLEKLRISAYSRSVTLTLIDNTPLLWNFTDEEHLALLVTNEVDDLVATVRAVKIKDQASFLHWTNIILPEEFKFPILYLKSGSTAPDHCKLGLNVMLKMELVRHAIGSNIWCLVNTINKGPGRIHLLEGMKMHFSEPKLQKRTRENSPFIFNTPLLMGVLRSSDFSFFEAGGNTTLGACFQRIQRSKAYESRIRDYLWA